MTGVLADTHAALWFLHRSPELSTAAREALRAVVARGDPVHLSAISLIEIAYLVEKGRIAEETLERLSAALDVADATLRVVPVDRPIAEAVRRVPRALVPDMPDRIIAATAMQLGLPLVTCDRRIRSTNVETIW